MTPAKPRVIVNPAAAGGKAVKFWRDAETYLRAVKWNFDCAFTTAAGDATRLARAALEGGCPLVVAVGGDGTLSEVVNGLAGPGGQFSSEVVVGVLPAGRGSDFARTLGIPADGKKAAKRLLGHGTMLVDLGQVEYITPGGCRRRYFVNVAGLGFDAEVAERADRGPRLPGSTIPYLASLFATLLFYRNKYVEVVGDGFQFSGRANSVIAANGQYFGGGMRIAPDADLRDSLLDVVIVGDTTRGELVANLPKLYKGTHLSHPKVSVHRTSRLEVRSQERMRLQADGDVLGEAPVTFRVIPQALCIKI